jgi:hypothetical protein
VTTYHEHSARQTELDVIEFTHAPDSESIALRIALERMRQDLIALQKALARTADERDQWRAAYDRILRENTRN